MRSSWRPDHGSIAPQPFGTADEASCAVGYDEHGHARAQSVGEGNGYALPGRASGRGQADGEGHERPGARCPKETQTSAYEQATREAGAWLPTRSGHA